MGVRRRDVDDVDLGVVDELLVRAIRGAGGGDLESGDEIFGLGLGAGGGDGDDGVGDVSCPADGGVD